MSNHQYLTADFEEPIDIDGRYHVRVFKHGDRLRYHVQGLNPPVVLTKPKRPDGGKRPGNHDKSNGTH